MNIREFFLDEIVYLKLSGYEILPVVVFNEIELKKGKSEYTIRYNYASKYYELCNWLVDDHDDLVVIQSFFIDEFKKQLVELL